MIESKELQEQYDTCRSQMTYFTKQMHYVFILFLLLGGAFIGVTFFATLTTSTDAHLEGASKFYQGFAAGAAQWVLGILTWVLGFWACAKHRLPSFLLIGVYAWMFVRCVFEHDIAALNFNLIFSAIGLILNARLQYLLFIHTRLKGMPGYPQFSLNMDRSSTYEPPAYVTMRRPSDEMEAVDENAVSAEEHEDGDQALEEDDLRRYAASAAASDPFAGMKKKQSPAAEEKSPSPNEMGILSDMEAGGPGCSKFGDVSALPSPEDVRAELSDLKPLNEHSNGSDPALDAAALSRYAASAAASDPFAGMKKKKAPAAEEKSPSPNAILSDMDAGDSGYRQSGDVSALPSPEDVRAQLQAMRQEESGKKSPSNHDKK